MERGPLALFGAIVAIGVGPALWLGAQLGTVDLAPPVQPATVGEQLPGPESQLDLDLGGVGAGDPQVDSDPVTGYTISPLSPRTVEPTTEAPFTPPVEATRVVPVSPSVSPSISSSAPVSASPSADDPETPPTESTEDPDPSWPPVEETPPQL
ncbi:hypothetical protein OHA21_45335 [Actinoplanes sp. NBC_00393]|uniref:hypothetical protein n=1 Tax=Actinoplanes sp. NBC_00393 TaxID=2975953 RepID=UPI002E20EEBE